MEGGGAFFLFFIFACRDSSGESASPLPNFKKDVTCLLRIYRTLHTD